MYDFSFSLKVRIVESLTVNYAPDIAVFVLLFAYAIVEERAMRNWAIWAFRGIVVFRRREHNALGRLQGTRIDRFVAEDEDLKNTGLGVKEVAPGLYLARFLPRPHRWWCGREGFESPVTSQIRIDYTGGDIEFTARLSTAQTALISFWFADMVFSAALARHPLDLMFALLVIPAIFLIGYQVGIRRNLQDFWFLLTAKLNERR